MDSIEQLNKKFQEELSKKELKEFTEKQTQQILLLTEENEHLKKLITSNDSLIIESVQKISPEELICLTQIQNLKKISDTADLTFEEVKKFSELVKTLRLIKGKEKADNVLKDADIKDLLSIVEDAK